MILQPILDLANKQADETYSIPEAIDWINDAIAEINMYTPLTKYPYYKVDGSTEAVTDDVANTYIAYDVDHPLGEVWSRKLIAKYTAKLMKTNDSETTESNILALEFADAVHKFKSGHIPTVYQVNTGEVDYSDIEVTDGVYIQVDNADSTFGGEVW